MSPGNNGKKQSIKPSTFATATSAKTVIKTERQTGSSDAKRRKVQSGLDDFYGSDGDVDDAADTSDGVGGTSKCMLFDDDNDDYNIDDVPVPEPEIALTKTPLTKRTLLALVYPSAAQPTQEEEEEGVGGSGSGRDPVLVRLVQTKVGEQVSFI